MFTRSSKAVFVAAGLGLALVLSIGWWFRQRTPAPANSQLSSAAVQNLAQQLTALETREQQVAQTVYAPELLAQECGRVIEDLWDALNGTLDKFALLETFPIGELKPPRFSLPTSLPHGVAFWKTAGDGPTWNRDAWRSLLQSAQSNGWRLAQCEFRHNRFETNAAGLPARSVFYGSAHLVNPPRSERAIIEGDFLVEWAANLVTKDLSIRRIDASQLELRVRAAPPAFQLLREDVLTPPEGSHFIDPLLLHDLDGDGLSEIILAAANVVYRREGGALMKEALCRHAPGLIFSALVADFDGDGAADLLCANFDGLVFFHGSASGTFDEPGRPAWQASPRLKYAQVLTCGDIDADGDLDVWLGQYKVPYKDGQMPFPYHDANDGFPAYLLLNDGRGQFTDATAAAGLSAKRMRRSYSASFADLDGDHDLDLLVVSDFAGLDLYANDGRGHFAETTPQWVKEPRALGMAHALADFNADGQQDLLMIGMNSPSAERLQHLGLVRPGFEQHDAWRGQLTFGNRLFLGAGQGGFEQTAFNDAIARSGWSWGCSALDFDNDGFPDAYVANGHENGQTVQDYEPEFWMHDIYVANSRESVVNYAYFGKKISATRGQGMSYGGYEKNRLYWNQQGATFVEIAHLFGLALEEPSRNVVSDDLNGDGRMDLLVTTFQGWPQAKQTLRIYQNNLPDSGNWIGVRLRERPGAPSPIGAKIIVRNGGKTVPRQLVTGDSYRSQHATAAHFGLGSATRVESVDIRWADGRTFSLPSPVINRWHSMDAPIRP